MTKKGKSKQASKRKVARASRNMHKEHRQKLYSWYPYLIIAYAIMKLIEAYIVTLPKIDPSIANFFLPFSWGWLVFNLMLLFVFVKNRFERIALVMPIYYLVDYALSLGLGAILALQYGLTTLAGQTWILLLTVLFTLFEISFAYYLIYRRI
jgi:hypothetical protein